jgi:DNA polymerase-3 subunit beta
MRVSIPQPSLLKSLQVVERAVNDRSALPILANVLFEIREHSLILTATDLDVGIRYQVPISEVLSSGAMTLPARRLTSIIRELPDESVTIEGKKNFAATLACASSQFRIQGLPPEDFPIFPALEQQDAVTVPSAVLASLIAQTMFAMSLEETRFILNGTLLKLQGSTLTLAATDGRRLAVATATLDGAGRELNMVVPAKTIRELSRLLQDAGDELVRIAPLKDNQLLFEFGGVTVITRLIDGQFPPYESVIPAPSTTTLTCNRQLLMGAIRRASLMTTATSQAVVFELSPNSLVISKESAELGSAHEQLPVAYGGQPMTIAFNPEFWLEVLKVLDTDDVVVELTASDKPAVIRRPQFLYIVLPMKLA